MKAIGLYPSSTGRPGGKETGHRMSHYIVTCGRFAEVLAAPAKTGWKLDLESAQCAGQRAGPDGKTPFICPACGAKAWGKPDLQIACIPCGARMVPPQASVEPRAIRSMAA
jgi:hypothetical protein